MGEWTAAIVALVSALVTVGGLIHTIIKTRSDARQGISQHEQVVRRDTVSDRDALIDQFQEIVKTEREERQRQVAQLESRISELAGELREEREYTDELREHIYLGNPPPPPRRGNTGVVERLPHTKGSA